MSSADYQIMPELCLDKYVFAEYDKLHTKYTTSPNIMESYEQTKGSHD